MGDLGAIPVDDAGAALRYCQALARQLESSAGAGALAKPPGLSVVIPVFNEIDNLAEIHRRLVAVLENERTEFEIIFVDDGSQDGSIERMNGLAQADRRVRVIELARNFGHQVAITAGLDHARGDAVIVMDADLQDPPEELPCFIAKWRDGYQVVYAIREQRKESWFKRTSYALFYRMLRRVANIEIPLDAGDFCIMDRQVVDLLKEMPERNRFVRGIRSWVGLKQTGMPFERQARFAGESKYTMWCLILLALDGLISFSFVPLRVITGLGLGVSVLSLFMALFFFVKKLLYGLNPPGYASLIVSIFFSPASNSSPWASSANMSGEFLRKPSGGRSMS